MPDKLHHVKRRRLRLLNPNDAAKACRAAPQQSRDTQPASQMLNWGAVLHPLHHPEAERQAAEKAERIKAAFRERLRLSGLQGDWRVASGKVSETVVCQARHADLIILGQVDPGRALNHCKRSRPLALGPANQDAVAVPSLPEIPGGYGEGLDFALLFARLVQPADPMEGFRVRRPEVEPGLDFGLPTLATLALTFVPSPSLRRI
jgi:hypothetical protein